MINSRLSLVGGGVTVDLSAHLDNPAAGGGAALDGVQGLFLSPVTARFFEGAGGGASFRGARRGAREVTLPVLFTADDRGGLLALLADLATATDPSAAPASLVVTEPDGTPWQMPVVATAVSDPETDGETYAALTLTLRGLSPYWLGADVVIENRAVSSGGRTLVVDVEGDTTAALTVVLMGPATSFEVTDRRTGARMVHWAGSLGDFEAITFDFAARTAIDSNGGNRYSELTPPTRFRDFPHDQKMAIDYYVWGGRGTSTVQSIDPDARNLMTRNPGNAGTKTRSETPSIICANLMLSPYCTRTESVAGGLVTTDFGTGGNGSHTQMSGRTDGPMLDDGRVLDRYMRKTWTVAGTGSAEGAGYCFGPWARSATAPANLFRAESYATGGVLYRCSAEIPASSFLILYYDSEGNWLSCSQTGNVDGAVRCGTERDLGNGWRWAEFYQTRPASNRLGGGTAAYCAVKWVAAAEHEVPAGTTLDIAAVYFNDAARSSVAGFCAGDAYGGGAEGDYTAAWEGEPNRSTSTLGYHYSAFYSLVNSRSIVYHGSAWSADTREVGAGQIDGSLRIVPSRGTSEPFATLTSGLSLEHIGGHRFAAMLTVRLDAPHPAPEKFSVALTGAHDLQTVQGLPAVTEAGGVYTIRVVGTFDDYDPAAYPVPTVSLAVNLGYANVVGPALCIDNIGLIEILDPLVDPATVEYFDGGSTDVDNVAHYEWEGTANSSNSVRRGWIRRERTAITVSYRPRRRFVL